MYKYARREHAKLLLNLGVVRIGTLYDFRRMEHRSGIADPTEGTKEVFHHIDNLFIADSEDPGARASLHMRALEEFHAVKISNSRNTTFSNVGLSRKFNNPDCYLFCTSAVHSRTTMAQFEGTDSCVEIIDVQGFYRLLTASLNALNPVVFRGIYSVSYKARSEPWNGRDWGGHPALTKGPTFAKQAEVRAIWQPLVPGPVQPVITGDFRLCAHCRDIPV